MREQSNFPDLSQSLVQSDTGSDAPVDLSKRTRPHEVFIQIFLFACGALSIFTTAGIILILLNESVAFFTRDQWVSTNREIIAQMDDTQTAFDVQAGLGEVAEGELIRVGTEIMRVQEYDNNTVKVDSVGTGAGFARFCSTDEELTSAKTTRPSVVNASRAITADELAKCAEVGLKPIDFRVGTDALAIIVSADNDFLTEVTLDELPLIFGSAKTWSDVRPEYPDEPIQLIIPGTDSGTFDYFVESVFAGDKSQILANNPVTSENDNQLVGSINRNPYGIGFFGYAYYQDNSADLKILTVEGVTPSATSVEDGTYALARPLYIYSDAQIMKDHPQIAEFIDYYLTHVDEVISEVGYFSASQETLAEGQQHWLTAMGLTQMPDVDPSQVAGHVETAGSSTILPLTQRLANDFALAGFTPRFIVERGVNEAPTAKRAGLTVELDDRPTLIEFFTNASWIPAIGEFGVVPLINATLMTSVIGMLVALPLGLGAAIYLSEYATPRVRNTLKPILEVLAGIPTVVYGYFALTFMTPLLRSIFGIDVVNIYNTASAGIVLGILIIPLVSSMSEDALHAVPQSLRDASYGLGATKLETTIKVVIPAALSGLLAAFIVAVSRAIGETMVVAIAAGAGPNFTFNPFDSAETMTGHIARISGGDLSYDSIDYNSIFAIGLTLFLMTFILNILSRTIIGRFREAY